MWKISKKEIKSKTSSCYTHCFISFVVLLAYFQWRKLKNIYFTQLENAPQSLLNDLLLHLGNNSRDPQSSQVLLQQMISSFLSINLSSNCVLFSLSFLCFAASFLLPDICNLTHQNKNANNTEDLKWEDFGEKRVPFQCVNSLFGIHFCLHVSLL